MDESVGEVEHKREKSETVDLSDSRFLHAHHGDSPHPAADSSLELDGSGAEVPPDSESERESEPKAASPEIEDEGEADKEPKEEKKDDKERCCES